MLSTTEDNVPVVVINDCGGEAKQAVYGSHENNNINNNINYKGGEEVVPPVNLNSLQEAIRTFPNTLEEIQTIEDMLAKEMDSLTLAERDKILFDIHGISLPEPEDLETINDLLVRMEDELHNPKNLQRWNMEGYNKAKYINEKYVSNRKFRLMFLRSEGYNPKLAAETFVKHFEIKNELFGLSSSSSSSSSSSDDILGRDICLSDLSEDDIETLESGFFQIASSRDVAGRSIFFQAPRHRICKSYDNVARVTWYVFMKSVLHDEDLPRKGFILIIDSNGGFVPSNIIDEIQFVRAVQKPVAGFPQKLVGCHFCGLNPWLRPFNTGMRLLMGKELRTRIKDHYGDSYNDMIFKLQTYGIKAEDHPIKEDGSLSLDWHHEWIRIQKLQEESAAAAGDANVVGAPMADNNNIINVVVPRRFDVLFGKSKMAKTHTGNLRCSHLVDMYQREYETANKFNKTTIAERILDIVHESYGRFLKWDDANGGWVEVDRDAARDKVSHYFRLKRSKKTTTTNTSSSPSSSSITTNNTSSPTDGEQQTDISMALSSSKRRSPCPASPSSLMDPLQESERDKIVADGKVPKRTP